MSEVRSLTGEVWPGSKVSGPGVYKIKQRVHFAIFDCPYTPQPAVLLSRSNLPQLHARSIPEYQEKNEPNYESDTRHANAPNPKGVERLLFRNFLLLAFLI